MISPWTAVPAASRDVGDDPSDCHSNPPRLVTEAHTELFSCCSCNASMIFLFSFDTNRKSFFLILSAYGDGLNAVPLPLVKSNISNMSAGKAFCVRAQSNNVLIANQPPLRIWHTYSLPMKNKSRSNMYPR